MKKLIILIFLLLLLAGCGMVTTTIAIEQDNGDYKHIIVESADHALVSYDGVLVDNKGAPSALENIITLMATNPDMID